MLSPKISTVVAASNALIRQYADTSVSYGSSFVDLENMVHAVRRCPNDQQIGDLLETVDAVLCDMDDAGVSNHPTWEALADALDNARALPLAA